MAMARYSKGRAVRSEQDRCGVREEFAMNLPGMGTIKAGGVAGVIRELRRPPASDMFVEIFCQVTGGMRLLAF